jgi:pyruvate dehydrogenase (quinone)
VNAAEKVTVFCGRGVEGAHEEVMAFAEKVKAPVGHALRGKEHIQYDNPYDVGMSGLLGYGAAYEAMHECDLLLLLGTDFPYANFLPVTSGPCRSTSSQNGWAGARSWTSRSGETCARR